MNIFRSLRIHIILAVLFVLQSDAFAASPSFEGDPTMDEIYQVHADIYFMRRQINQNIEMAVREAFLKWLYDGIVDEVKKRKRTNPELTLEALNPPELKGYSDESYNLPENIDEAPPQIAFSAYEKFDRDEYNHKYLHARLIKNELIKSANSEQRQRMFSRDLKSTIFTYRDGYYSEAILKFDELIKEYGFNDLDDIFFYRGESYFAMNLNILAIKDFEAVNSSGSANTFYHKTALRRLISLYGDTGKIAKVRELWSIFQEKYSQYPDDDYWQTLELVARYLMLDGKLEEAILLFDQIPQSSDLFIQSQLYAAQTTLMQLDLDEAEERFNKLIFGKYGKIKISKDIKNQSRLKIGYVYFLRGEFNSAFRQFSEVEGKGKLKEIALISSAWAAYRLNAFEHVITVCNSFKSQFPNSEYQYEATALMGHCREIIGQDSTAVDLFEEIMTAVDDRQDYREFIYEKQQISKISADLKLIENEVFGENRKELFPKYLSIREKLFLLRQKTRLAEGFKANPGLGGMIVEQATLAKIINGQQALEAALDSAEDRKSLNKYERILTNLSDLSYQISGGIKYELSRTNLSQREEKRRYESSISDSLGKRTLQELGFINASLEKVKMLKSSASSTNNPELMIDLTAVGDDLQMMKNRLLNVQTSLSAYGDVEVSSNLDEWSDFAYLRYTYGGLDFDNFSAQQDRLTELDGYIQQLSQILAVRHRVDDDTTELATNLILASAPGEEPYRAPPVPLWGTDVEAALAVPTTLEAAAVSDTTMIEEIDEEKASEPVEEEEGEDSSESDGDGEVGEEEEFAQPDDQTAPPSLDTEETESGSDDKSDTGETSDEDEPESGQPLDEPADPVEASESDKEESLDDEAVPTAGDTDADPSEKPEEPTLDDTAVPDEGAVADPGTETQPVISNEGAEDSLPDESQEAPDADTPEQNEEESNQESSPPGDVDKPAEELTPEEPESLDPEDDIPSVEPDPDPNKEDPTQP